MSELATDMPRAALAEPAGGQNGGPATSVWSGGGNGRGRAPETIGCGSTTIALRRAFVEAADPITLAWQVATTMHDAVWDAARWYMAAAAPLPLVSPEPWSESDAGYRERLGLTPGRPSYGLKGEGLDFLGHKFGLPRARLVPTPQSTEENRP